MVIIPAGFVRRAKQHELSQTDFDAYTERLQPLPPSIRRVQVVFSVADLKTSSRLATRSGCQPGTFDGSPRFLGLSKANEGWQSIYRLRG